MIVTNQDTELELKTILGKISSTRNKEYSGQNIMGCSENWYSSYYAIAQVFTDDELASMSKKEIDNLIKLAEAIQEALY